MDTVKSLEGKRYADSQGMVHRVHFVREYAGDRGGAVVCCDGEWDLYAPGDFKKYLVDAPVTCFKCMFFDEKDAAPVLCGSCNGYGHTTNGDGPVTECLNCHGEGFEP